MRNLGLVIALWLAALLPTHSLALGLGEIEVKSFLNQPLEAEIEVISARPGEIDDLLVSLASREAFSRAGLSRPSYLSDLRFAVRKNDAGDEAVILVTTKSAVKEPFLNFLIEADWSKGRVLREFTVLLDPPFFADQPPPVESVSESAAPAISDDASVSEIFEQAGVTTTAEADSGGAAGSGGEQVSEPIALTQAPEPVPEPAAPEPLPAVEPIAREPAAVEQQNIIEGDVLVVKGDTLWSIASRYRDGVHSMSQIMLAFQRANPDAFNDGNINNMKEGAILRAPSAAELDAIGQQEAYAEVLVQNGLWDEYVARVTGTAPAVAAEQQAAPEMAAESVSEAETGSELSLLMPGEGETESTGTGDAAELLDLRNKLAMAEEELEAARIENRDLESRIAELQARLSKVEELQKMVEIEDDSLARLQSDQATEPEAAQPEPEAVAATTEIPDGESEEALTEETVGEAIKADEEALLEELLAEEAAAQAEEQVALQQAQPAAGDDGMKDDEAADSGVSQPAASDEATSAPADAVTPPPAPVIVTEPVTRKPSMLDGILPPSVVDMIAPIGGLIADPLILAAVGGVIILLLILFVIKRRRGGSEDESGITTSGDDLFVGEEEEELTPIHLADGSEPEETDIKIPTEEDLIEEQPPAAAAAVEDDMAKTAVISAVEVAEPEAPAAAAAAPQAEQDDVLNEVDVYLAYGLYDNAEELLNNSLNENPDRADYRSKLLDTYFATKNADAFVNEAEKLKSMGDAGSRYWDRVQVMGYELAPDNPLFSEAKDSGLSAADLQIAKPQEADFDLGASDGDDTNFSTTDFQLSAEDTDSDFSDTETLGEAGKIAATQQISQLDELPDLDEEEVTNIRDEAAAADDTGLELPDEIGQELEFSMDEEDVTGGDEDAMAGMELPDDFELDTESEAAADDVLGELDMDFGLDEEDQVELEVPEDDDEGLTETAIVTPNYEETSVMQDITGEDDSEIDLGMDDTSMMVGDEDATGELNLETGEISLPTDDMEDDDDDISIIDFGGDDFVEPTDNVESVGDATTFDAEIEDSQEVKTGTFAPGDFEEPTATESLTDMDDIGDLMLPDDVDEVSTKLDLARAFIDMGDTEGARGSLEEVISEGNEEQKAEAKALLAQI